MALTPCGRGPMAIYRHWGGRWLSHAAHTSATAPSLGRGSGPWAPGGRRVVPKGAALGGPS